MAGIDADPAAAAATDPGADLTAAVDTAVVEVPPEILAQSLGEYPRGLRPGPSQVVELAAIHRQQGDHTGNRSRLSRRLPVPETLGDHPGADPVESQALPPFSPETASRRGGSDR